MINDMITTTGREIRSRFDDATGNTLDHVDELGGDTLEIWGGEKGSPAVVATERVGERPNR